MVVLQNRRRRERKKIRPSLLVEVVGYQRWVPPLLFWAFKIRLFAVVILFLCWYYVNTIGIIDSSQLSKTLSSYQSIPVRPCSFEELWSKFGRPLHEEDDPGSCWSLEQMIMRVPVESISNRETLVHLGSGRKGGVFRATVAWHEGDQSVQCSVAIKSNQCFNSFFQMLFSGWRSSSAGTSSTTSCLATSAVENIWGDSFLRSEYTGALPFYAHTFINKDRGPLPGLLPTWGVVVLDQKVRRRGLLRGVVGAVMPLQPFAHTLDDPHHVQQNSMVQNLTSFYEGMLEAARGLALLHKMGLVHQDVKAKNVGVLNASALTAHNASTVVLYDNTFVRRLDSNDFSCPPHVRICQYCMEPAFSAAPFRFQDLVNGSHSQRESDTFHLKAIIRNTALRNRQEYQRARQAARLLKNVSTDTALISAVHQMIGVEE